MIPGYHRNQQGCLWNYNVTFRCPFIMMVRSEKTLERQILRGAYYITSFDWFQLDIITETLNIKPTCLWQQSNPLFFGNNKLPKVEWGFQLPYQKYDCIDSPANEILNIFWPLKNILVPFAQTNILSCCLDIELNIYEDDLDLPIDCTLETETLKKICELESTFQITHHFHYL